MRIGFGSEWIGESVGGVERYAIELLRHLVRIDDGNTYEIFTTPRGSRCVADLEAAHVRVHATASNSRWHYVPIGMPLGVLHHPVDVLHAAGATVAPWCPTRRIVLTVHDVGPDVHPDFFPRAVRRRYHWLIARGVARATRIIVPSHATRRELLEQYRVDEGKVRVVYEGVTPPRGEAVNAPADVEVLARAGRDFILTVGRFHARKNQARLLQAFAIVRKRCGPAVKLVMPGRDQWHRDSVLDTITALGLEHDVVCPGWVNDALLDELYRRAAVFAFPSLHEGFGLPPLEAMGRGVPVMASNVSAMAEILGDAAYAVDPYDPSAMAVALERLMFDAALRTEFIERGLAHARRYSWEAAARATLDVYREAESEGR